MRDPGIKLFGMKINALPENDKNETEAAADSTAGGGSVDSDQDQGMMEVEKTYLEDEKVQGEEKEEAEKEDVVEKDCESIKPEEESPQEMIEEESSPESDGNPKKPSIEEDTMTGKQEKNDQTDAANSQNKTLKKPDKILPCPRCNSMDTKFCYYNNYNVNQPRHFCKSCQRYWTAGGTMRSMPVGAGRRKNKNSNSHCRYITIPDPFQATRIDANDGNKVLSFGPGSPILESMASALNLADKRKVENGDDCSSGSTITTSNSSVEKRHEIHGFPSQIPCIPGVNAWPFPIMCPPGYPPTMPFYPPPYYGAWNFPWLQAPPPPPPTKAQVPDSNSPVLGKHSREGDILNPCANPGEEPRKQHNGSVLIPKTLRIDDPDEAAKSSIWATLGIKNENNGNRGGLFKAFQAKGEEKNHAAATSPALQANPAALSRSLCFQERV